MRDVEKSLDILNSERLELQFLTYKLTLLALAVSSRAHEICTKTFKILVQLVVYFSLHQNTKTYF